jgi:protein-S-isoprenylcysteine O-methyltransferase Ste14
MKQIENFLKWIFKQRGLIMAPPVIFATLCTWNEMENDLIIFGVGDVLFIAGLLLRIWAQMHLHYRLKIQKALTTTGPYGYIRNPMYIGNMIMLVGATITSELLWFTPVMLIYCAVVYNVVVRFEESHLLDKYGDAYAEYISKVPRWIPRSISAGSSAIIDSRRFLLPSLLAEAPSLLLLLPFLIKEVIC